jgi:Na+/proline symporter
VIWIDWAIVVAYLAFSLWLGLYLARKASGSVVDFFVSGRSLPWWLAGTSMAATTFSIDTPLYIAGVVGNRGIAGNWEWWSFGIAHVVMIYRCRTNGTALRWPHSGLATGHQSLSICGADQLYWHWLCHAGHD